MINAADKVQQNLFPEIEEHAETKPDNIRYAFESMKWLKNYHLRWCFDKGIITFADFVWYYAEEGDKAFVPEWAYEEKIQMIHSVEKRKGQKVCFEIPELECSFAFTTNEKYENACFEIFSEDGHWTLGYNQCSFSIQHYHKSNWFDLVPLYAIRNHLNNPPLDLVCKELWAIKPAPLDDDELPNRKLLTIERKSMVKWLNREGYRPRFF